MRVLLTPHDLDRKLANGPVTFVDSDPVNGNVFDNTNQNFILIAWNTDAATQTIEVPKRFTADGDSFVDDPLDLAAGEIYAFDWFENAFYGWNDPDNSLEAQNAVVINTSSANIKLAVLPVGSRSTITA